MAKVSLYRKYRPSNFNEMLGQEHIVQTLRNQIKRCEVSHAYIFTGTRGTGKTSTAKILAKAVNCLNPQEDGSPCGKCDSCSLFDNGGNFDIIEIDAASNNGVNEIRDLCDKTKFAPTSGKYKVYIIDEVHSLSGSAFNALLKTLEEPPSHVIFILATTDIHKVPATILSRCIRFDFRLLTVKELASHLKKIFDFEGRKYEMQALIAIAEAGEGSVRDALSIADNCASYCENEITLDQVLEVLGANSPVLVVDLVGSIMKGDIFQTLITLSKLTELGKNINVLSKDIIKYLRVLLYIKNCQEAAEVLDLPREIYLALEEISKFTENSKLLRAIELFINLEGTMRYSSNPSIMLETAAIKACDNRSNFDNTSLVARVNEIENAITSGEVGIINISKENTEAKKHGNEREIWGRISNVLLKRGSYVAYTCAQNISFSSLKLNNDILEIKVDSKDLFRVYNDYVNEFETIAVDNFSNVNGLKLIKNFNEIEIEKNIEEIKNIFGDEKVVVEED